jgi:acyl-coenzyme A synthetase/AMP-(fatty) acid ligase/peptidoglycan/LPS O-acetylase OafA/YrhL
MERLFAGIEAHGDAVALIDEQERAIDYTSLAAFADAAVSALGSRRRLIAIEAENELAPIGAYLGALRAGHVVLLANAGGAAAESRMARQFQPEAVFRRGAEGWGFEWRDAPPCDLHPDLAVLLSSSGSTGSPKLIRLSHDNLRSNARAIAEYLEFGPGERAITSLPPYYSYGLSVIHSHLFTGNSLVLTDHSVAEEPFWSLFDRHKATSFAGVPHSFELLERSGFLRRTHESLRYFTQAGGKLAPELVRTFGRHAAAQAKRFYIMYGQTEASPRMAYLPPRDVLEHADCIGRPIPGGSFSLEPLDDGSGAGELIYRGPNVMMGYALTRENLAEGPGLSELRTGDIAELTPSGLYRIVGRASRFVKLFGLRIGLDDVEARLRAEGIAAVAAGDDKGLVVATEEQGRRQAIEAIVRNGFALPPSAFTLLEVDRIPRLPTGKVDYRRLVDQGRSQAPRPSASEPLREAVARVMGLEAISGGDSFVGLGGDSLNYIQVVMLIEDRLGEVPADWETISFDELEAMTPVVRRGPRRIETDTFLRAAAIIFVVFHHVTKLDIGGAAYSLLAIAGFNFSRFQVPQLLQGRTGEIIKAMLLKIALPYYAIISLVFFLRGFVFLPQYLLVGNMTTGDGEGEARRLTVYWFIETYIDLVLLFCLLFTVPAVRRLCAKWPWEFAIGLLAIAAGLRIFGEYHGDMNIFFKHGPFMLAGMFVFGWAVSLAESLPRKLLLAAFAAISFSAFPPGRMEYGVPVILLAVALLLFVPRLPVGDFAMRVISTIAASSLYIYMSHPLLLDPVRKLLGGAVPVSATLPVVLLCLLAGVIIGKVIDHPRSRSIAAGARQRFTGKLAEVTE